MQSGHTENICWNHRHIIIVSRLLTAWGGIKFNLSSSPKLERMHHHWRRHSVVGRKSTSTSCVCLLNLLPTKAHIVDLLQRAESPIVSWPDGKMDVSSRTIQRVHELGILQPCIIHFWGATHVRVLWDWIVYLELRLGSLVWQVISLNQSNVSRSRV